MKGKFRIWFGNLFKKGTVSFNRDALVFTFFLFLSFLFWFLNALDKDIEAVVRHPVRYINIPEDRVLSDDFPGRLIMSLKGPGYSILKHKLSGNRIPVIIDISDVSYRRVPGSKALNYYITTSGLIQKLSNKLTSGCEVIDIQPDTLFFTLDRIISKNVPVIPDIEVATERQYFTNGDILIEPDSVTVTGPKIILDTIKSIKTRYKKLSGLSETVKKNFVLNYPEKVNISERRVTLTIPIEQFTEAEILVPVKLLNVPDTINIKIFPDEVSVKCLVAISDYNKINNYPFNAVLDLKNADLNSTDKIPVEILNIPDFISKMRIMPGKVDFLIEKK